MFAFSDGHVLNKGYNRGAIRWNRQHASDQDITVICVCRTHYRSSYETAFKLTFCCLLKNTIVLFAFKLGCIPCAKASWEAARPSLNQIVYY